MEMMVVDGSLLLTVRFVFKDLKQKRRTRWRCHVDWNEDGEICLEEKIMCVVALSQRKGLCRDLFVFSIYLKGNFGTSCNLTIFLNLPKLRKVILMSYFSEGVYSILFPLTFEKLLLNELFFMWGFIATK